MAALQFLCRLSRSPFRISTSLFRHELYTKQRHYLPVVSNLVWCFGGGTSYGNQAGNAATKFYQSPSFIGINMLRYPSKFFTTSSIQSSPLFRSAAKDEPSPHKLIYTGTLSTMVRLIKFFSLSTSIVSSGLLAVLYMSNDGGVMTYIAGGLSSVMILTPIVLHWFTKGYIIKMYYDFPTKTYTAYTLDFFLTDVKTDFKRHDVSLPTVSSVVSSFAIRGKPVLVDPRGFLNPNYYSHLMGYTDTDGNVTVEEAKKAFESSLSDDSKS